MMLGLNFRYLPSEGGNFDVFTPHYAISARVMFASLKNCSIVTTGYCQVIYNLSNRLARLCGCVGFFANIRRLGCRIASKQLWPLAYFSLYQLVVNKKKQFSSMTMLWLNSQQLNTKIPSGRAFGSAPDTTTDLHTDLHWPLNERGLVC